MAHALLDFVPPVRTGFTLSMEQASSHTEPQSAKVVSMDEARRRLGDRDQRKARALSSNHFEISGLELERLTPEAKELLWLNVSAYAQDLVDAAEMHSDSEEGRDAPVTPYHVESADAARWLRPPLPQRSALSIALDIIQLVGAATCGALAAKPGVVHGYGFIALALAMMLTAGSFLVRQGLNGEYPR